MKNIKIIITVLSFIAINADTLFAQNNGYPVPPCAPDYFVGVASQQGQALTSPYYTTDMPLDVLIGYIVIDSLMKVKTRDEIEKYIDTLSYSNDTLRRIMKYLYTIVDFDPIRFRRYTVGTRAGAIADDIITRVCGVPGAQTGSYPGVSPQKDLDRALLGSDIIAQIKVNEVEDYQNSNSKRVVTAEIIESIKGKNIPQCVPHGGVFTDLPENQLAINQAVNGSCLQFSFPKRWLQISTVRGMCDVINFTPYDSVKQTFRIEKDREYIIFLAMSYVCYSSTSTYFSITPLTKRNCLRDGSQTIRTLLALPIENGKVNEGGSDLGIGSNLTPTQYIAKLKERRDQILNLTNSTRKDDKELKLLTKPSLTEQQRNK